MPLQNRVTPQGDIVAVAARGSFTGNRGVLHDANRRLTRRRWTTRAWIICLLSFKGRHREVMTPRRWTELFFLDEATALSAGHRPCGECRRADYLRFKAAWIEANLPERAGSHVPVAEMDRVMHADRVAESREKRRYAAAAGTLPDGTMVCLPGDEAPWLLAGRRAWRWTWDGYRDPERWPEDRTVEVLTPRSTVAAIGAGYRPMLHPSASA